MPLLDLVPPRASAPLLAQNPHPTFDATLLTQTWIQKAFRPINATTPAWFANRIRGVVTAFLTIVCDNSELHGFYRGSGTGA
jgi:hypothetical protein